MLFQSICMTKSFVLDLHKTHMCVQSRKSDIFKVGNVRQWSVHYIQKAWIINLLKFNMHHNFKHPRVSGKFNKAWMPHLLCACTEQCIYLFQFIWDNGAECSTAVFYGCKHMCLLLLISNRFHPTVHFSWLNCLRTVSVLRNPCHSCDWMNCKFWFWERISSGDFVICVRVLSAEKWND